VHHEYEKVGEFWVPARNQTDSAIRLGGHALLSIEYKNYKVTGGELAETGAPAGAGELPKSALASDPGNE